MEAMEATEAHLSNVVVTAVPSVTEGRAKEVAAYLVNDVGITSMERLNLIRESDFCNANLLPAEARLCLLALTPPEPLEPDRRRRKEQNRQRESATNNAGYNFVVDWDDIKRTNDAIIRRLDKGKKLSARLRRQFVGRLVHQVRTTVPGATRIVFKSVMVDIKTKYPISFRHELAKGKVGKRSITRKCMEKFDNDKRPPRRTKLESEAPTLKAANGCIKWRTALPDGQTSESQEQICEELKEYFQNTRPKRYDWDYIEAQMKLTYSSQRKDLNKQAEALERLRLAALKKRRKGNQDQNPEENLDNPDVLTAQIADTWPFLFQARGMRMHFTELTGVNFGTCIENLVSSNQLDLLIEFCKESLSKSKPAKKILKKLKSKLKSEDLSEENKLALKIFCLIRLLIIYFKEDVNELLLCVESTTLEGDVANECQLPKTPTMIIAGDEYEPTRIFFAADGTLLGTATTLLEGLELVFSCYFVLNLVYAPHLQITLEFIQRVILGMVPPRGNRRPAKEAGGYYSSLKEHLHLGRFAIKFDEFLAGRESSESEENHEDQDTEEV